MIVNEGYEKEFNNIHGALKKYGAKIFSLDWSNLIW